MNRLVGLLAGFLATTASLVTTIEAHAQEVTSSANFNHTYGGVHRCGGQQNLVESENAARNYVNNLSNQLRMPVFLVSQSIVTEATRHWKERGRLGEVKARKCETTMTIKVNYRVQLPSNNP